MRRLFGAAQIPHHIVGLRGHLCGVLHGIRAVPIGIVFAASPRSKVKMQVAAPSLAVQVAVAGVGANLWQQDGNFWCPVTPGALDDSRIANRALRAKGWGVIRGRNQS